VKPTVSLVSLVLAGKPYGKTGCSHFLFLEAVITDAQLTCDAAF
jgi:hypothetical protein